MSICLVTGSRSIQNYETVCRAFESSGYANGITHIVVGDARGVDTLAVLWAKEHSIVCSVFKADWNKWGRSAGYVRNQEMVNYAKKIDPKARVLAIWDKESRGTKHCFQYAKKQGLEVFVFVVESNINGIKFWILEEDFGDAGG